jgi:hypothetical protein
MEKTYHMTESEFNRLNNNVQTILDLIQGEGTHRGHGMIDRQCKAEKRLAGHDKILWMLAGAWGLILALLGITK